MRTIFIIKLILILVSCGPIHIENIKKDKLSFDELPDTVKNIYESDALIQKSNFEYIVIATDKSITFKHRHTGMDDGILTLLTKGFNHHFYINRKHFTLKANQGDPFILHDGHLYYSLELNLAEYNFKKALYVCVDLKEYMK